MENKKELEIPGHVIISNDQQQSPFYYQPSSPFTNQLYMNSPTSNLFTDRNDNYLPFSTNTSYLNALRFSPNQAYRTTKSGKQQIGPENSNLFI